MLKKFFWWFVIFGLSFLVSNLFGWAEQGKAFLYIHMGGTILLILIYIVVLLTAGTFFGFAAEANGISLIAVIITAGTVAIALFVTWGVSQLFGVDFYVAYEIITFLQCLFTKKKGN